MKIFIKGSTGQLQGDLTDSGVTGSCIDSLSDTLQQIASRGTKHIRIDCCKILKADMGGLRLLYVWMQCARFTGIEPELINLSQVLRGVMCKFGMSECFLGQGA